MDHEQAREAEPDAFGPRRQRRYGAAMLAIFDILMTVGIAYPWEIVQLSGRPQGAIYPAISKLRAEGIIEILDDPLTAAEVIDRRAIRRIFYGLTARGEDVAELHLRRNKLWDDHRHSRRARAQARTRRSRTSAAVHNP